MQKSSLHYYLLPSENVFFENLEDTDYVVTNNEIKKDTSPEGVFNALKYRYSLKYLGKSYDELFVLCIPAQEHHVQINQKGEERLMPYPRFLKTGKQTQYSGFASGRRSAIFFKDGKMIRYKGCGNDTQGFVVENKGLRGSHFFHTAKRELFMTQLINNMLINAIKIPSANTPLFFYRFPKDISALNLKNEAKLLSKYCCVFETIGDRRVGTHLISPLQIFFLNIIKTSEGFLDQIFKKKQRLDQYGLVYLLTDFQMSVQNGDKFLDKYDKSKQFTNYVSIQDINKQENNLLKIKDGFDEQVDKIKTRFGKVSNKDLFPNLSKDINWIKIVGIILQRVGWQMGQIKRIFCEKQINWGFFNDHGYWHCNAHLNNFITTVPKINERFIYPLDFDLAFTKDEYININLQSENYGERDDQDFEQLLLSEYNSMQMSVSGEQIMNFKYSIQESKDTLTQEIQQIRIIFRDTLVKNFRDGMRNKIDLYQNIQQQWNDNINEISKLIEFSLLLSADFQT